MNRGWVKLPAGGEGFMMASAAKAAKTGRSPSEIIYVGEHEKHAHCVACGACEGECHCA